MAARREIVTIRRQKPRQRGRRPHITDIRSDVASIRGDTGALLDASIRKFITPPLDAVGRGLARIGVSANQMTLGGFVVGLLAVPALAFEAYTLALAFVLLNRLSDGLDGALARARGATDFGGFLDIACDFLFYAAVPFGFALADPAANALPAAFLLLTFVGTGSSFLTYAVLAAKHGIETTARGPKALYYLGGLTEGTETIAAFVLFCLLPDSFPILAFGFGALCCVTTLSRFLEAKRSFHGRTAPGSENP